MKRVCKKCGDKKEPEEFTYPLSGMTCIKCQYKYVREWRKKLRYEIGSKKRAAKKKVIYKITRKIVAAPILEAVPEIDEMILEIEEICCEDFGCGKTLSMTEKLFGNKCQHHSI